MAERKLTYSVEVDARQAQAAARVLREIFESELRAVQSRAAQGNVPGAGLAEEATRPVAQMKRALEEMGRVDLTKPADALLAQLAEVDAALRRTRGEYERLGMLASARGGSASARQRHGDYVDAVRTQVSDEAAAAMVHTGRALNIGQRGAEFKVDEESLYLEAERDFAQNGERRTEKMRYNAEEKQRLAQLEMEMYEAELQSVRIQQELAQRRLTQFEQQVSGLEFNEQTAGIYEEAARVEQETRDLAQQEESLLRSLSNTNERLGEMMAQQAARQARRAGEIVVAPAASQAATASQAAVTSQAAITVSGKSVENAEKLAAALREAAEASQRIEASHTSAGARSFELETEREKLRLQQLVAQQSAALVEEERTRGAAKRAEIAKEVAATQGAEQQKTAIVRAEAQERATAARTASAAATATAHTASAAAIEAQRTEAAGKRAEIAKEVAATQAAEQQKTAIVRAEAQERAAAARTEAAVTIEAARTASAAAIEEERRRTAEVRAQLRKERGTQLPFGMTGTSLAMGAAAAVGIYSVDQVARTALDWGRQGAQQERMAQTFEALSRRTGQNAGRLVASIRQASQETITDMDAMGLASQVLASKWSGNLGSLDKDMGTLVAASRRFSQIYTDETGQMLTTQEIFARLIKYTREGNKELVDQFGISNARIAASLGQTVEGLASASGATDRWRGLVQVLGEDLARLGEANLTTADKIEQSVTRIITARQRIQGALAEPTAYVYEAGANVAEGVVGSFGETSLKRLQDRLAVALMNTKSEVERATTTQMLVPPGGDVELEGVEEKARRVRLVEEAVTVLIQAEQAGVASSQEYREAIHRALDSMDEYGQVTDAQVAILVRLIGEMDAAIGASDSLGDATATTSDRMEEFSSATEGMNGDLRALAMVALSAGVEIENLGGDVERLKGVMDGLASAHENLFGELDRETGRVADALESQARRAVELVGPAEAGRLLDQQLAQLDVIVTEAQKSTSFPLSGPQMDLMMEEALLELQQPFTAIEEAERARVAAEREWERAAERTANEMERAAEQMVSEFKSSLQQVPGLFGGSQVTGEQMRLAEAGVSQNFADDYLRRLRDEVLNNKDWADVDIGDAASRAGIDASLPKETLLTLFEQAWQDQSLFAGGKNVDLINQEAVRASLARQEASKSGQEALFALFGVGGEKQTLAQPFIETPVAAPTAGEAAGGQLDGAAMLEQMTTAMEAGLDAGVKDRLFAIGGGIVESIHAGFSAGVAGLEWGSQIIDSIAAAVAGPVFDMLNAEMNKP